MRGTQVTGLVSWRRIFQMSEVLSPPLTPNSCATLLLKTSPVSLTFSFTSLPGWDARTIWNCFRAAITAGTRHSFSREILLRFVDGDQIDFVCRYTYLLAW